jgi:hypothetical protein
VRPRKARAVVSSCSVDDVHLHLHGVVFGEHFGAKGEEAGGGPAFEGSGEVVGGGQKIAGELFGEELVIGLVFVEGGDDSTRNAT